MKDSIVTSGLVGAVALTLFAAATPALAGNPRSSRQMNGARSPLILAYGGGNAAGSGGHRDGGIFGGGTGGHRVNGGHESGFGGGHDFRGGFSRFDDGNCWWSARRHREICY